MAKKTATKKSAAAPSAEAYMDQLSHPLKDVAVALRAVIRKANRDLVEGIKWNAPSYSIDGEDRITFNLRANDAVRLVFHCGAKVKDGRGKGRLINDESGLLQWASDDRAIASFSSSAGVKRCSSTLTTLINAWLDAASCTRKEKR
jgi:hypothetical protein